MTIQMLKGKIHRAKVVQAELNYVGSITVDPVLMEAAGIYEYEKVQIVDVENGSRFETYTIAGEPGSGMICLNEIRFLISGQPDIMDVTVKELFNFPAGVDVVHIGIQNDLEHHPGVVRAAPAFLIQLSETFKIQALNQGVNHAHRIVFCNILINSWRKKHCLVGIVRTKMYLCHSIKSYA